MDQLSDNQFETPPQGGRQSQSAINLPPIVSILLLAIVAVHLLRTYGLTAAQDFQVILQFSFIPAYFTLPVVEIPFPASRYWSFVSYAILHADWTHVLVNSVWMVAFGSVVARRFGTMRFLLFTILSAMAGAAAHFVMHMQDIVPVIGASASVSAYMGAACRFVLTPSGLGATRNQPPVAALSLAQALSNRSVIGFVAVWFALNFLFGSGLVSIDGTGAQIAWEAHVGGFLFGLLLFSWFDPVPRTHSG